LIEGRIKVRQDVPRKLKVLGEKRKRYRKPGRFDYKQSRLRKNSDNVKSGCCGKRGNYGSDRKILRKGRTYFYSGRRQLMGKRRI